MDILLKQRLTGAVVLISFVVIFIPMLLSSKGETYFAQAQTNIPPLPSYEFPTQAMELTGQKSPLALEIRSNVGTDFGPTKIDPTKVKLAKGPEIGPIVRDIQDSQGTIKDIQSTKKQKKFSIKETPESSVAKLNKDKIEPNITKSTIFKANGSKIKVTKASPSKSTLSKSTLAKSTLAKSTKADTPGWIVQVGSFRIKKNALTLNRNLMAMGYTSFIKPLNGKNGMIYRVRVGPELSQAQAEILQGILDKKVKLKGLVMRY